jgi:hypothetical protein
MHGQGNHAVHQVAANDVGDTGDVGEKIEEVS